MEHLKISNNDHNKLFIITKMKSLLIEIIESIFLNKETFSENEANNYFVQNKKNFLDDFNQAIDKEHFTKLNLGNGNDIIAVKNCAQLKGFLCGYHTLFNTINFLKFYYSYEKALKESSSKNSNHSDSNNNSKFKNAFYFLNKIKNRSK